MDTTKLIVEYLVSGTLTVVAILAVAASWFPNELGDLLDLLESAPILTNEVILTTVFIALAYALGIISEYVGEKSFESLQVSINI